MKDSHDPFARAREIMVKTQLESRDIHDPHVLQVMRQMPRHLFVPEPLRDAAYDDGPLSIGYDQTISQPYIVAYMTQALQLKPQDTALEIGTGCGYQTAVLSRLVKQVDTLEIIPELAAQAFKTLRELGYSNVTVRRGDGYQGWPQHAPFDAVMITAAPQTIPEKLIEQLKTGGRMILPVGINYQELVLVEKTGTGVKRYSLFPVRFVPMTGKDS